MEQQVSPTGQAVIPAKAVPLVLIGIAVLNIMSEEVANPAPWTAQRIMTVGIKVGTYLALGSLPGLRRQPVPQTKAEVLDTLRNG
jgi:hypothetical protein